MHCIALIILLLLLHDAICYKLLTFRLKISKFGVRMQCKIWLDLIDS